MNSYYATFPAGCYDIIVKHLKSFKLDEFKIAARDDSSVLFESSLPIEKLIELRYFTNVYFVVDDAKPLPKSLLKGKYFRLMLLKEGAPQSIQQDEKEEFKTKIKQTYKLEPNTHLSKNDFYLIERKSGKKLLTLRFPKAKFKREKLSAGELRPELAHILCLAAGVKAKHVLLDMFAGYGSIPYEAVRGFGCRNVTAVDIKRLPGRHEYPAIEWQEADARNLDHVQDNSIDRVVTDPPWGIYDAEVDDLSSLYKDFTEEMTRTLRPGGVAVVLSGFEEAAEYFEGAKTLQLINKWNVLVSGKKATIYKLQKTR